MSSKKNTGLAKAGIFQGNVTGAKDPETFKQLTVQDFRHDIVYHVLENEKINPVPVKLTGNLAKDAEKFQAYALRGVAYAAKVSAKRKPSASKAKAKAAPAKTKSSSSKSK